MHLKMEYCKRLRAANRPSYKRDPYEVCWSIHLYQLEERSIDGAGWLFPIVGLLSLSIKSPFKFSSPLFLFSSRSDHAVERFSLALRSHTLKSFCFLFICAFSPHICLQLVNILIIYVVSMCSCLNVWTLSLHDIYVWFSVCTLS